MSDYEFRSFGTEIRVVAMPDNAPKITGYVAIWGARSRLIPPGFVEVFAKGSFKNVLENKEGVVGAGDDIVALVEHDVNRALGRRGSGTLKLWEDDKGLAFEVTPANTEVGRSALEHVGRRDYAGMSFKFKADKDEWNLLAKPPTRTVKNVTRMPEVSVVMVPAFPATTAEIRSHVDGLLVTGGEQTSDIPETTGNETETDPEVERLLKFYDAQGVK